MLSPQKNTFFIFTFILSISIYFLLVSEDKAEKLQNHIYNCDYDKAIILAESILKNPYLPKEEKIEVFIHKAIAEYSSNRILDSQITLTKMLMLDEKITLNSNNVSPKIIELFSELKNRISKNPKVKI